MSVLVTRSCRALGVGITEGFFYLFVKINYPQFTSPF